MSTILEIPEVRSRVSRLSVEEYNQPGPDGYQHKRVLSPDETLECSSIPALGMNVSSLFP